MIAMSPSSSPGLGQIASSSPAVGQTVRRPPPPVLFCQLLIWQDPEYLLLLASNPVRNAVTKQLTFESLDRVAAVPKARSCPRCLIMACAARGWHLRQMLT